MTEHKFTDEEIIRALEHCVYTERGYKCRECVNVTGCKPWLLREALDLINRQKAEIERLLQITQQPQAEAVKEFAERLKTYYRNLDRTAGGLVEYHIDQIVKEMTDDAK